MQLNIQTLNDEKSLLISIESDHLDAGNVMEFKNHIQPHLDNCNKVILDMKALQFVDSSGLGALLSCLRAVNNKQGTLQLIGMTKPVRALFELVRMHRIFPIFNTLEDAQQAG